MDRDLLGRLSVFKLAAAVLEAVLGSVPLVNWLVGAASGLGVGLIVLVWLVGAVVIVVVGLLARRVAG